MRAVLKHELRSYFTSLTAYLFGAFLLLAVGIGAMLYNLQAAVSNFEYVLSFACLILSIIVPILTMRIIAEERKQKTDQLLYSLPITTVDIIIGKYLALLLVFLVPMLIICTYPLVFAQYGDVYLPTSYGSMVAFFIMGAALIAIGVFISSLTENQGFAVGVSIAIILFNYYSVSLSEFVSATAFSAIISLIILSAFLALIIKSLTRSVDLAYLVFLVLFLLIVGITWYDITILAGLLPSVMAQLSLFDRFYAFVSGVFDLTAIVYYITVIIFFLFLSVQSLEKRRYN